MEFHVMTIMASPKYTDTACTIWLLFQLTCYRSQRNRPGLVDTLDLWSMECPPQSVYYSVEEKSAVYRQIKNQHRVHTLQNQSHMDNRLGIYKYKLWLCTVTFNFINL